MITSETAIRVLFVSADKARRSVARLIGEADWKGDLALPTVYWSGIDSEGAYMPSLSEWFEEVSKRHFRKIAVGRFGLSYGEATKLFYETRG